MRKAEPIVKNDILFSQSAQLLAERYKMKKRCRYYPPVSGGGLDETATLTAISPIEMLAERDTVSAEQISTFHVELTLTNVLILHLMVITLQAHYLGLEGATAILKRFHLLAVLSNDLECKRSHLNVEISSTASTLPKRL